MLPDVAAASGLPFVLTSDHPHSRRFIVARSAPSAERPRPPFLAGAHRAIPQRHEARVARLQRREAVPIAEIRDERAVVLFDQLVDAVARFERRPREPAGEILVVFGL